MTNNPASVSEYQRELERRMRDAVQDLAGGACFRRSSDGFHGDDFELVHPTAQPEGDVFDRLLHHGWLESFPNGGGYKLSDAGKLAYLRSTDELGDGQLIDPKEYQQ